MTGTLSMFGTFSKAPRAWGFDESTRVRFGYNGHLFLNDGVEYIDWVCGLGSNLLGYANDEFNSRVMSQVVKGAGFSLPHYLEDDVAEKLVSILSENISYWRDAKLSVRFAKTGSEANSMAVRLARAVTGKDIVLHCGYGGWGSEFVAAEPPAHGIPINYKREIIKFSFGENLEKYNQRFNVAAVMLEQGIVDPKDDWYIYLRDFCNETGALLIIDEVVTGLRYGLGGASECFDIQPDIMTMGKGLGNGFAVSAVIASKEIMSWFSRTDPVFCSSTHWGEAVSLAAANAMLDIWDIDKVNHIYSVGFLLMEGISQAGWNVIGHAPRSLMTFSDKYERAFFVNGMKERGILMNRPNFICHAHTNEDVANTVDAAKELWKIYTETKDTLEETISADQIPHVLFSGR